MMASMKLDTPFAIASQIVLVVASWPGVRNCLKNSGKNTTITVVANDEFAQSYNAQAKTFLVMSGDFMPSLVRYAAAARCSRVSRKSRSGQRSSVSCRLTRVGARYTSAPE